MNPVDKLNTGQVIMRLGFMSALFALVGPLSFSTGADADENDIENNWAPLLIVDVQAMPWDEQPRFKAKSKTFFRAPNEGTLIYARWEPTWTTEMPPGGRLGSHYHLWNEWAYMLRAISWSMNR